MQTFFQYRITYLKAWETNDRSNAIKLAKKAHELFLQEEETILLDLIIFCGENKSALECKKYLNIGFGKGYWYPEIYMSNFIYEDIYKEELAIWQSFYNKIPAQSTHKIKFYLPKNYKPTSVHTLIIGLHGDGENIDLFESYWCSSAFEDFIIVNIQAKVQVGYKHFVWEDRKSTFKQIDYAIKQMKMRYPISSIILGGHRKGGDLATDFAFHNKEYDVKGFIAVNSCREEGLDLSLVKNKIDQLRGVVITSDKDIHYMNQVSLIKQLDNLDFDNQFIVVEAVELKRLEDLNRHLDFAAKYIMSK